MPMPRMGQTYGDFAQGSARRVFVPNTTHIQESHNQAAIAETVQWMRQALDPPAELWIEADSQIWPLKEWATLVAMLAGLASLLPAGMLLLSTSFFADLRGQPGAKYACSGRMFFKHAFINGLLMWLYLPLIFVLFGLHIYVVRIDKAFPMMLVNAIVWWFVWINVIGFFIFRRWYRKTAQPAGISLGDLGISFKPDRFALNTVVLGKTLLLAIILFGWVYGWAHFLEKHFIVDFRFIFPFASDLTGYRANMFLIYFPYLLLGFLQLGIFLHGQLRPAPRTTRLRTFAAWSSVKILALIVPLLLFSGNPVCTALHNRLHPLRGAGRHVC